MHALPTDAQHCGDLGHADQVVDHAATLLDSRLVHWQDSRHLDSRQEKRSGGEPCKTPSPPPCPSWCQLPAGHGFDSTTFDNGHLARFHERPISSWKWTPRHSPQPQAASVAITAMEIAEGNDGPVLECQPPTVSVTTDGLDVTGPQARQLAASLLDAADAWDAVVREPPTPVAVSTDVGTDLPDRDTSEDDKCPSWCARPRQGACHYGYHSGGNSVEYVPALADVPKIDEGGAVFPIIGAFPIRDDQEELPPAVSLHITGAGRDAQVDLLPAHARAHIAQVQAALDMLAKG